MKPFPFVRHAARRRAGSVMAAVLALLFGTDCASSHGQYTWIDDYPQASSPDPRSAFELGYGDLVNVQVWENDKISTRARVRADGMLAIPLVGDIIAVGKSPRQFADEIERSLREQKYILTPRVTVVVDEVQPLKISVIGAVLRAGTYSLDGGSGVADALASAGGLTEFAHRDRIFVLRRLPAPARIRFTFNALTEVGRASAFHVQTGDIVVAE